MGVIYNRNRKKALLFIPSGGLGPSVSADFSYSKSSFNQGEADPTPTITGTAGGTFNADAGVVFVDTGSFNSSTGQIDLSATTIDSHIITYTVDGVQSGQTVGVTAAPYSSTSSFTFDGVNDRIWVNSQNDIDLGTTCSISFWMNGDASYNGFVFGQSGTNAGVLWASTTVFYFYVAGSFAPNFTNVAPLLTANNWHNVVITRNGISVSVYVNGSFVETQTGSPFTASTKINQIGARGSTSSINMPWEGKLDEVGFWNTALSSDAITEIYNSGAPNDLTSLTNASSSNLKAWYKMGE